MADVAILFCMSSNQSCVCRLWNQAALQFIRDGRVKSVAVNTGCRVPLKALLSLAPSGTNFDLGGAQLEGVLGHVLARLPHISRLSLASLALGPSIQPTVPSLLSLSQLESLDLSDNSLPTSDLVTLLPLFQRLVSLNLSQNYISGQEGGAFVSRILQQNSILKSLKLSRCAVQDAGALAIATTLPGSCLRELILQSNHIGSAGAASLAHAAGMSQLAFLDISGNNVGRTGNSALWRSLRSNKQLCLLIDIDEAESDSDGGGEDRPLIGVSNKS
eukprot:c10716_g1_i3.p1 GENE.c10716_g1_i3~~c10716_g1_i3.p1  ORF type:complete len:274 (+),score=42.68 c10716_g1_i3:88-909(+)